MAFLNFHAIASSLFAIVDLSLRALATNGVVSRLTTLPAVQ
jgi:hypothetical protein